MYYTRVLNNVLMLYKLYNNKLFVMVPSTKSWIESNQTYSEIEDELHENNFKIAEFL